MKDGQGRWDDKEKETEDEARFWSFSPYLSVNYWEWNHHKELIVVYLKLTNKYALSGLSFFLVDRRYETMDCKYDDDEDK